MSTKLATIIIPTYNRADTVERCLDSIAMQRNVDKFKIIIVDNNSVDNTRDVVEKWRKRHQQLEVLLLSESRQGATAARNAGLDRADADYVMFFDSDDEMLQGHLSRIVKAVADNPEIDIFGWDIASQLADGRIYKAFFKAEDALKNHLIFGSLSTQRYIARTELVRAAGKWNTDMAGWNDFELGVRLLLRNPKVEKIDNADGCPLVKTYFTDNSITGYRYSDNPSKWENSLLEIERNMASVCPDMLPWVGYRRAVLAGNYYREGAKKDAQRLLAAAQTIGFGAVRARLIYDFTRLFGRGARYLASFILRS